MKYYLAFREKADCFSRIDLSKIAKKDGISNIDTQLDLSKLIKKDKESNISYFSSIDDAVAFTTLFKNYSELYLTLLNNGIITYTPNIGETALKSFKPFVLCYEGIKNKKIKQAGTKSFYTENKILFKDDAYLMEKPSKQILIDAYDIQSKQQYVPVENKYTLPLSITRALLSQGLWIPNKWVYEKESERVKYDFLRSFVKEIYDIVESNKNTNTYHTNDAFAIYTTILENYKEQIDSYLNLALVEGTVIHDNFDIPMRRLVQTYCVSKNDAKKTLSIKSSNVFHLATFYTSFFNDRKKRFANEANLLKSRLEGHYVQLDLWGNEIPMENFSRKRKRY